MILKTYPNLESAYNAVQNAEALGFEWALRRSKYPRSRSSGIYYTYYLLIIAGVDTTSLDKFFEQEPEGVVKSP